MLLEILFVLLLLILGATGVALLALLNGVMMKVLPPFLMATIWVVAVGFIAHMLD